VIETERRPSRPEEHPEGNVTVRAFTPADLAHVTGIERASFGAEAFPESTFRRLHALHPGEFLVAAAPGGAVVGYITGAVAGDRGEIQSVAVNRRARGRGIGSLLARRLLDRFRQLGLRRCVLQVRTTNAGAIDVYRRLGFRSVRTLAAYYADGGAAFLMEKRLAGRRRRRPSGAEGVMPQPTAVRRAR
jgi:ribosomal-protein-alanine N-acetyltransferase